MLGPSLTFVFGGLASEEEVKRRPVDGDAPFLTAGSSDRGTELADRLVGRNHCIDMFRGQPQQVFVSHERLGRRRGPDFGRGRPTMKNAD
jgi:hypothetical protein